jgi:hypothetical protein
MGGIENEITSFSSFPFNLDILLPLLSTTHLTPKMSTYEESLFMCPPGEVQHFGRRERKAAIFRSLPADTCKDSPRL